MPAGRVDTGPKQNAAVGLPQRLPIAVDWACMIAGPWRFGLGLLMGYPLTSDRRPVSMDARFSSVDSGPLERKVRPHAATLLWWDGLSIFGRSLPVATGSNRLTVV